jgi:regulator of replication initiation timing
MPLDRTLTVKKRRIDVYLPTLESKARWNEAAAKHSMSLSQYVAQVMEERLNPVPEAAPADVSGLQQQVGDLVQENAELRKRIEELEKLHERAEADLAEYRAMQMLGGDPVKRLDSRLVKFLSQAKTRDGARPVPDLELRRAVLVNPKSEAELKALARQLEFLELHEVVKRTTKGWIWRG